MSKADFHIVRLPSAPGFRYVFERNGEFGLGPKSIATKFRGRVDAERVRRIVVKHGVPYRRSRIVRA